MFVDSKNAMLLAPYKSNRYVAVSALPAEKPVARAVLAQVNAPVEAIVIALVALALPTVPASATTTLAAVTDPTNTPAPAVVKCTLEA
jgi:hypothetical protein